MIAARYFIAFWVLLLICLTAGAQTPVWTQFTNSPSGTTRHDDIYFVNETHGWTARGTGGIYKTSDGGRTWVQKLNNPNTHFRSIGFVSELLGFAGNLGPGSYDPNVTDTNLLYRTFDGGETWSPVQEINGSGMKGFCAIHVLDAQNIFGGGRVRGPAHFVKSNDGGTNWTVVDLTAAGIMGGIMDIYFKDPMNGFVVGMDTNAFNGCVSPYYHGAIARTTNGGVSWQVLANSGVNCSYFWKMSWPTTNIGYASLQQNGSSSSVIFFKTIDGGNTWMSNGVPYSAIGVSGFFVQGIGFISATEGWLGGASSTTPYLNNFLHTTNGGLSWTPIGYNDSRSINKIRIYPKFVVASGAKLHVYRVPLAIVSHPQSQTNTLGSSAIFSVTAYGTPPLDYQWRFNGTNISGGTTNTYSIPNVQAGNAGNYDVVVSDYSGFITSSVAILTVEGVSIPPTITSHPQSQIAGLGATVSFAVSASGSAPLQYQWRLNGANLTGETFATLTRANVQAADAGTYSVVVTNGGGSTISEGAALVVVPFNHHFFQDDFDAYGAAVTVTNAVSTNGYRILFGASSGGEDFKAVFGFDYSTVTFPTNIPSAPHSSGGTTRGLYLSINKELPAAAAAVNLYPIGVMASNNFSLKFDLWQNWTNLGSASEHALVGINHSGNVTNRVQQSTSDGLFFAINSDGNVAATAAAIRDFAVFRGGSAGVAPILMLTNNTSFGPTPPLGPQFDNNDPGFLNLFPSHAVPGYTTPAGSPGLSWVSGEVRQENGLITWLLNGVVIAQYTNTFAYTNGTILIGYNDTFDSIGNTNNFIVFDNIRVERLFPTPIKLLAPQIAGSAFHFLFDSDAYAGYSVQRATNLLSPSWTTVTNLAGNGSRQEVTVPLDGSGEQYFRVTTP